MLRQPLSVAVKVISGRKEKNDLHPALFWSALYAGIAALALLILIRNGFSYLLYLAAPGVPVFAWHLWLVSRRAERRQAGVEVIATGVLSLSAAAIYWVGLGAYSPTGWLLWLWAWMQSAASIVYAYLRLEQREWKILPDGAARWRVGRRAALYTSFNLLAALILAFFQMSPPFVFVPFLLQWIETLWGIAHPSMGWKPARIGLRQTIVSAAWVISFIFVWR
ncbi:MAG: hypothetical protein Fur002_17580 [Anaerolineales bacterium]